MKLQHMMFVLPFAFATTAQAVVHEEAITLSGLGGYYRYDSGRKLDNEAVVGLGVGYNVTSRWAVEALGMRMNARSDMTKKEVHAHHLNLNAVYHLQPAKKWNPYVSLGYGLMGAGESMKSGTDNAEIAHRVGAVNAAVGVKWDWLERLQWRAEVRDYQSLGSAGRYNDVTAMVGVHWQYAAAKREKLRQARPQPLSQQEYVSTTAARDDDGYDMVMAGVYPDELDVKFDFDRAEVQSQFLASLKPVAEFLKSNTEAHVVLAGHADSTGNALYNVKLSRRRAQAVAHAMQERYGVDQGQMVIEGYGADRPMADNGTDSGRALNRRVESHLVLRRA